MKRRIVKRGEPQRRPRVRPQDLGIGHDPVNEQVLIAAVATDAEARRKLLPRLPPDSFFGKGHAEAWEVLQRLARMGLEVSWDAVKQLGGADVDVEYLRQITTDRPKPPNLGYHVGLLEWDRARVEAARGPLVGFLNAIKDPTSEPEKVIALLRATVGCLEGHGGGRRFLRDPNQLIRELGKALDDRLAGEAVWPFGWQGLDLYEDGTARMIPGAKPGKMTLIVGESGAGKSTIAAWIALGLAGRGDMGVKPRRGIYCAWEMDSVDTIELLALQSLGWSRTAFYTGQFDADEKRQLLERCEELSAWITFVDMPFDRGRGDHRVSNDDRLDVVHGLIEDAGAEWAIFDLWKRALYDTKPSDEEQALKRQQSIAKETRCHCILLHHLRKEDVGGKVPSRKAIKGSSAWIDVPDTIIGMHLPALHGGCDDVTAELIILKQRYTKQYLAIEFDRDAERGTFTNGRSIPFDARSSGGPLDNFLEKQD